ncbi:MAG: site-specific DNA-methyltransferase [Thermodesulfobacteriota bacterium]|nr:site-specific DNA-methyltransferase [Thermodesulfobacteriota bacterium]
MARKKNESKIPVETLKHKDKRVNIPTEELRDFVAEYEAKPKTVLYPRDPSLDPQLVWKGKDEQDSQELAVPAVPVYIQEKIHPKAIIENIRSEAKKEKQEPQISLFADFNGIDFEKLVDFYQHEQNWSNRKILGDSLLVMTSLAEKEGLKGKVQMIYIDPPYGIKFGSNWQVSTRKRDVRDGKAEDLTRQPEQIRAFRDTWALGIHSYLGYLRDRLVMARELLTETGSIFVQIGDENVSLVRCLMDEVFGGDNFVAQIYFVPTTGRQEGTLDRLGNYLLWFAKNLEQIKFRRLFLQKILSDDPDDSSLGDLQSQGVRSTGGYPVSFGGKVYYPLEGNHWKITEEGMKRLIVSDRVQETKSVLRFKRYSFDFPARPISDVWTDTSGGAGPDKIYVVQTSNKIVERCLLMTTDPGDLVLDPTCGSGTAAYVAEQWGRRWITIDTSRVALALARTRLMAAKYPYYLLADSPEGIAKEAELTGKMPPAYKTEGDIKKGFVYKRVPHITLKSIANNPDIKEGMFREEIDAAIARHAETEILYDQPYQDNKRIRVTGPFTMESLSPHRVLAADEELPVSKIEAQKASGAGQFEAMIIENLKKAGVQNRIKNERLKFDRLESYAGQWLHAEGEYAESDGKPRRAAVCIGPEHGTVGPQLVKEAAKEAVQGVGFDLLVICGFAFDPHVSEEAKRYGKLNVLMARMNPDLTMGDELLKKTGAGNLFMVFGEPDIVIHRVGSAQNDRPRKRQLPRKAAPFNDEQIVVEIKGLDVYDPTTGQIRSSSTDDIACWFIDTEYNGESFFVRHAYFTGAEKPYEKLKRALRAEVDESAWASLYSTKSRPFPVPRTGKIAIKVINHYGDEVLKVYNII